jgi:uncharacterized protein (DUF58 family)
MVSAISDARHDPFGPARGRGYGLAMLNYVGGLKATGLTDINTALKNYANRGGRPGLCFVVSDFFSPTGFLDGVNTLLGKGYEVGLIHILSPDEIDPPLGGDLRLVDVETGKTQEVTVDGGLRELYMKRFDEWRESIRADCLRRGVHYITVDTHTPWEKVILYNLRRLGAVK